ncbi:MAG TPA: 3-hydroxyacyl-CoA dehydrogenase [Methylocella sp.]|nr:3-hydroxyacyl-CoA dehydrogenase [Methylocella sp.]
MPHPHVVGTIGVVGAGAMGAGVAQTALAAGLTVILHDANPGTLTAAREQILSRIARLVEKGQFSEELQDGAERNLQLAETLPALAKAELVIEAIVEKLEVKQAVFTALEQIVKPETVLATNTSSLSVAAIARSCERRGRVCGMHFFNPVPLMKLVEVIGGPDTSAETIARALALTGRLGKIAVQVKDVPGFLVNFLGRAYTTEAQHIALEGVAPPAVVDRIMREAAGFRMGPFELMDLTGIDVNFPATTSIYHGFQHDPRLKPTIMHEALFNAGRYGRKTGQGFYSYAGGAEAAAPRPHKPPPGGMTAFLAEPNADLAALAEKNLSKAGQETADVLLIAPNGEDATTACTRLKLDPARVIAIDLVGVGRRFLTLMTPPGVDGPIQTLAAHLNAQGYSVATINDSPGFVAPRILAMIANLGCEAAQIGVGAPADIDLAMRLAQNYPRGPLEWAAWLGPARVLATLSEIQAITGSDRYRPSLWLRRRALLGLPIDTAR